MWGPNHIRLVSLEEEEIPERSLSLPPSIYLSLLPSVYLSLSLPLSPSFALFLSLPPSLSQSLSLSLLPFFSVSLSLISPSLHVSLFLSMCPQRKVHVSTWQKGNFLSATQKENSHQKLNLPVPWSRTSSLQYHEKINFHCLRHPVCGIFLWQPRLTNTDTNSTMEPKKVGNQEKVGKKI